MWIQIQDDDGDFYLVPLATAVLHTCYTTSVQDTQHFINNHRVPPELYDKVLMKIERLGVIA